MEVDRLALVAHEVTTVGGRTFSSIDFFIDPIKTTAPLGSDTHSQLSTILQILPYSISLAQLLFLTLNFFFIQFT